MRLRRELEALRDRLGVETLDILDELAVMLVEDAVLATLEAEAVKGSPGLAKVYETRATEAHRAAAAITAFRDRPSIARG